MCVGRIVQCFRLITWHYLTPGSDYGPSWWCASPTLCDVSIRWCMLAIATAPAFSWPAEPGWPVGELAHWFAHLQVWKIKYKRMHHIPGPPTPPKSTSCEILPNDFTETSPSRKAPVRRIVAIQEALELCGKHQVCVGNEGANERRQWKPSTNSLSPHNSIQFSSIQFNYRVKVNRSMLQPRASGNFESPNSIREWTYQPQA